MGDMEAVQMNVRIGSGVNDPKRTLGHWLSGRFLAFFAPKQVAIPVAVSVFPDDICPAPRSWAKKAYPKLIHYNKLDKGGHFAAWEQPQLLSEEIRVGLRSLRN